VIDDEEQSPADAVAHSPPAHAPSATGPGAERRDPLPFYRLSPDRSNAIERCVSDS